MNTTKRNHGSLPESGFIGVYPWRGKYNTSVMFKREKTYLGTFDTALSAAQARDNYILKHDLPLVMNIGRILAITKEA